eukprot:1753324-Rhodomonas_salina.1
MRGENPLVRILFSPEGKARCKPVPVVMRRSGSKKRRADERVQGHWHDPESRDTSRDSGITWLCRVYVPLA